jgi:hypothetical protein
MFYKLKDELDRAKEMYQYCLDMIKKYKFLAKVWRERIKKLEGK